MSPLALLPSLKEIVDRLLIQRSVKLSLVSALSDQIYHCVEDRSTLRSIASAAFTADFESDISRIDEIATASDEIASDQKLAPTLFHPWQFNECGEQLILTRSLTVATCVAWMSRHLPLPLMRWQEPVIAALFMDVGHLACIRAGRRPRITRRQIDQNRTVLLTPNDVHVLSTRYLSLPKLHAEHSAALVSSIPGFPSTIRRIIRNHHTCLNDRDRSYSINMVDIHMTDRFLAAVVRGVECLHATRGDHRLTTTATMLTNEAILGMWDANFVNLTLTMLDEALSHESLPHASPREVTRINRIDAASRQPAQPHITIETQSTIRSPEPAIGQVHRPRMELAGPHFRLSEQWKSRRRTARTESENA